MNSNSSSQMSLNMATSASASTGGARPEARKAKSRLRDFYGLSVAVENPTVPRGASIVNTGTTTGASAELNDKNFNLEKYLHTMFQEKSLIELARLHSDLSTGITLPFIVATNVHTVLSWLID